MRFECTFPFPVMSLAPRPHATHTMVLVILRASLLSADLRLLVSYAFPLSDGPPSPPLSLSHCIPSAMQKGEEAPARLGRGGGGQRHRQAPKGGERAIRYAQGMGSPVAPRPDDVTLNFLCAPTKTIPPEVHSSRHLCAKLSSNGEREKKRDMDD